jgi:ketol-acid reductoisomerase
MARFFSDSDCNPELIRSKKVAVIGYGSQGHAHALNLRDSGVEVRVGLYPGSKSWSKAESDGLAVVTTEEAAQWADVIMLNVPDVPMARIFSESVKPNLKAGQAVLFSHGFNVHYGFVQAPPDVDVILVAPKGQGHGVRAQYLAGGGMPALVAVAQDVSGQAFELALSYAWGLGCARAVIVESSFRDETEADLFSEQAVLCGGTTALVKAGFETLVDAGYAPEVAFFECLHELKLIVDLLHEGGITYMRERISDTAEWGDYIGGTAVISEPTREAMKGLLARIQDGSFAKEWVAENESGLKNLKTYREADRNHPIEIVGNEMRKRMKPTP